MRSSLAVIYSQLLATFAVAGVSLDSPSVPNIDINPALDPVEALNQLQNYTYTVLEQSNDVFKKTKKGCSLATATIRRDWSV